MTTTIKTFTITDKSIGKMYHNQLQAHKSSVSEESYFIAETILEQVQYGFTGDKKHGGLGMMCWGVDGLKPMESGLTFKVQGAKIKGHVEIEYLAGHDYYHVRIYDTKNVLKFQHNGCDFISLTELIDDAIEWRG